MKKIILIVDAHSERWKASLIYLFNMNEIKNCSVKITVLLLFFFGSQLAAQSPEALTEIAIANNLELKILEKEYLTALEKVPQVGQRPDPEVGVGLIPLPIETRLGGQVLRVGATQMLPWKGVLDSKKELALAQAQPLLERVQIRQLDIAYQIKKAWLELYELEQQQAIIERNLEILAVLDRLALAKIESGKASAADVLQIQLKVETLKQELILMQRAKAKPTTTINQLLQRALDIPINVDDSLAFAQIPFNQDSLMVHIKTHHPIIKMYGLQQAISEQQLAVNDLDNKPDFGVGLDYILVNKIPNTIFENNGRDVIMPKVSVKIPLYKKKYEAKEREEQLKIATLEEKKEEVVSRFMAMIDKAFTDYELAQLSIDLYEKQIGITESAINILKSNYSAKGNNFDELLRLENELINYELKIMQAIVQSHLAVAMVEKFIVP